MFIYSHFYDINARREAANTSKMFEAAVSQYVTDRASFANIIDLRNKEIQEWSIKYNNLVENHNLLVHYLPNLFQKEAMKQIIEGNYAPDVIETLKEYYDWIKQLKYNDTERKLTK